MTGIHETLAALVERMQSTASIKTVYGEPIAAEGKTLIPVARVAYGMGGGYGRPKRPDGAPPAQPAAVGESGGGGIVVVPVGVVEIRPDQTRFIPIPRGWSPVKWIAAMMAGVVIGGVTNLVVRQNR